MSVPVTDVLAELRRLLIPRGAGDGNRASEERWIRLSVNAA